jgi:hypothetical protein
MTRKFTKKQQRNTPGFLTMGRLAIPHAVGLV